MLRLCQRLLEEPDQARGGSGSDPDAERDGLQLLAVNLERRWEAIVMQTLQWQTRLQRELGREQVRRPHSHTRAHTYTHAHTRAHTHTHTLFLTQLALPAHLIISLSNTTTAHTLMTHYMT